MERACQQHAAKQKRLFGALLATPWQADAPGRTADIARFVAAYRDGL
jgi:hypothetical protein